MKDVRLYNVIFPVWMLMLIPAIWLIVIPGNFLVDSLVLLISIRCLKMENRKMFYRKNILKVFLFGFLADFIGIAFLFLTVAVLELSTKGDDLYLTAPATVLSGVCIFLFHYFISFRKCDQKVRRCLSLTFAIATAPYTFMLPSAWIY